jgi:hypothetical protein
MRGSFIGVPLAVVAAGCGSSVAATASHAAAEGGEASDTGSSPGEGGPADGGSPDADSALADASSADGQDADAGLLRCGTQTCPSNQVCVQSFPCGGPESIPGCTNPPPSCADAPQGCADPSSCTCFGAAVCQGSLSCVEVSGRNVTCANQ